MEPRSFSNAGWKLEFFILLQFVHLFKNFKKNFNFNKVRHNQDLLAMQRMGGKPSFSRGKRKKKKKKKRRKRKKKKQRSKGHPRKKLKFDESCECGVAPKPKKHGGLWVIC